MTKDIALNSHKNQSDRSDDSVHITFWANIARMSTSTICSCDYVCAKRNRFLYIEMCILIMSRNPFEHSLVTLITEKAFLVLNTNGGHPFLALMKGENVILIRSKSSFVSLTSSYSLVILISNRNSKLPLNI